MRNLIIVLILLHAIFLFPFLKPGVPLSHDGDGHLARIGSYYKAFSDGQIPPRWAGDLNFRFGTPVFIFNYHLPYYAATLLHLIGLNLEDTFKLVMSISFVLAGVGFFLWLSQLVRIDAAFLGAMLFGLAPYHFLNVFVRGAFGETVGLAIVPFVFWQIEKIRNKNNVLDVLIAGILYGLLTLAHNGVSIVFSPVFLLYCLFRMKNKYHLISFFAFFLIGILISAYFWLPAIMESRYVAVDSAFGNMYRQHFPPLSHLIYSGWGFGPDVNTQNGISPQVGIVLFIFVLIGIIYFFKYKDKFVSFWLFVFFTAIFLTTSLSNIFWSKIILLRLLEFPWRFTVLSSLAGAVIAAYTISKIKNKKIIYYIALIILISSLFYTKTNVQNKKDNKYYYSFTGSTVYRRAATTIWAGGDPFEIPENKIAIIAGNGKINNVKIKSNLHSFALTAESSVRILDNTFYFPGWKAEIDGKKVQIEFQDINHRGLITFSVSKGKHDVRVVFRESAIRLLSDIVSLLTIIIIVAFTASKLYFNVKKK